MTGQLPHRYPFLMVDRLLEVEPGKRAVAIKRISSDSFYSQGGTAGLSPEVLVLEAMAQAAALTVAAETPEGAGNISGFLAAVNDVVFHRRPRSGDTLVLTLTYVARIGPLVRFDARAEISGELAAEAGLSFTVEMPGK